MLEKTIKENKIVNDTQNKIELLPKMALGIAILEENEGESGSHVFSDDKTSSLVTSSFFTES